MYRFVEMSAQIIQWKNSNNYCRIALADIQKSSFVSRSDKWGNKVYVHSYKTSTANKAPECPTNLRLVSKTIKEHSMYAVIRYFEICLSISMNPRLWLGPSYQQMKSIIKNGIKMDPEVLYCRSTFKLIDCEINYR